jgi:talin
LVFLVLMSSPALVPKPVPQAQYPEVRQVGLSEPQQALVSTISAGQEAIDTAHSLLNEKAKLPPLGNDPASIRWKETQWNTNQQAVHSQVSAMNAATAQMVTLTGQGDETDHNAVGAAVNTISTNLPDMAREVKMLAALMDDKSSGIEGDDLMGAARTLCGAFSEMLTSAAPKTNEVSRAEVEEEEDSLRWRRHQSPPGTNLA